MAWRILLLAGAVGALLAAPALADSAFKNAGDAVAGHPGLTYADLVRQAVPDLKEGADGDHLEGHFARPPRHLGGKALAGDPSDPAVLGLIEDRRLLVGGQRRIALLADLGGKEGRVEGLALLMLFDDTGARPRLLDAADVGLDKDSAFAEQSVLPLGPRDAALVTYSEHSDADITMGAYMIVSPLGDRLAMVDRLRLDSERLCSWQGMERARFATAPDKSGPYRQITVTATAAFTHTGEDGCTDEQPPRATTHVFSAAWRWDPGSGRFKPSHSTLAGLDALNASIFR